MKKAALLFTGGKDSCLALLKAKSSYAVEYLLTILPSSHDSYMFHKPSLSLLRAQSKALNLPLLIQRSSKKEELKDLEKLLKKVKGKANYIITGAVASTYQRNRIKKVAEKVGMKVIMPLWGINPEALWRECLKNNFEVILAKIACEGLGKEWLNKKIDKELFKKFLLLSKKYKFHLTGEGGDFETAVIFCPLFSNKIKIKGKIKSESQYRHFFIVEKVLL